MGSEPDCFFRVASAGDTVYIKVFGFASAVCCPTFKAFVERMTKAGKKAFVVDLGGCKLMDSSFMGTLLGILDEGKKNARKVVIINADKRCYSLLQSVGLTRVMAVHRRGVAVPKGLSLHRLRVQRAGKEKLRRIVEEAHDRLIAVDESNRKRFEPLLKALAKEFEKE